MALNNIELKQGYFYHIYNRGINSCNLFEEEKDYLKFLSLLGKYVEPVAEIFSYVLMPNHFHILIYVKEDVMYKLSNAARSRDAVRFEDHKWETIPKPDSVENLLAFEKWRFMVTIKYCYTL